MSKLGWGFVSDLCISILEFKVILIDFGDPNIEYLCISILEFKAKLFILEITSITIFMYFYIRI